MGKDPAFLFYPNDYIGGTMGWTFEEKGAYMEILMMQFNRGHMTEHMIRHTIGQLWDNIKDKFIEDAEGLFYNGRLELEKNKRSAYTASRRNNVLGKNQYSKEGHMSNHMEDVNRDVNINKNQLIKESDFNDVWLKYPVGRRQGKNVGLKRFLKTVKTKEDLANINLAVDNYINCKDVKNGYILRASKWFEEWSDWASHEEPTRKERAMV